MVFYAALKRQPTYKGARGECVREEGAAAGGEFGNEVENEERDHMEFRYPPNFIPDAAQN